MSWLSIDDCWGAWSITVHVFLWQRPEQNLVVCSGKSEAEVTNNRRLRSTHCSVEANYWQTRSIARRVCDFVSAIAELLVSVHDVAVRFAFYTLQLEHTQTESILIIFSARQHTDARYWYSKSVCLSVRPSVRDVQVSHENGLTYRHSFFHHAVAQSFCFYKHQTFSRNSDVVTPYGGAKYRCGIKISRFSTNKSL